MKAMTFDEEKQFGDITLLRRGFGKYSVLDKDGKTIVPFGKYQFINSFEQGLARVRKGSEIGGDIIAWVRLDDEGFNQREDIKEETIDNKWGIINEKGEEVLPVIYDEVWKFYKTRRNTTRVVKDGVSNSVRLKDLNPGFVEHNTL